MMLPNKISAVYSLQLKEHYNKYFNIKHGDFNAILLCIKKTTHTLQCHILILLGGHEMNSYTNMTSDEQGRCGSKNKAGEV